MVYGIAMSYYKLGLLLASLNKKHLTNKIKYNIINISNEREEYI